MAYLIGRKCATRATKPALFRFYFDSISHCYFHYLFKETFKKRTEKWVLPKAQEVMRRAEEASQQCSFVKHAKS